MAYDTTLEERFWLHWGIAPKGSLKYKKGIATLAFIKQELKQQRDTIKIGDLRQWLNEKPKDRLIKDNDIKIMLGLESE